MRFDRESYRKLYVAESAEHQLMALASRGLRDYLLRFAAEDGTLLPSTTDPVGDMMVVLRARPSDKKLVSAALADLQRVGYLKLERKRLWIARFEDAQAARSPGALRQKKHRDKNKAPIEEPESQLGDVTDNVTDTVTPGVTRNASGDARVTSPLIEIADETRREPPTPAGGDDGLPPRPVAPPDLLAASIAFTDWQMPDSLRRYAVDCGLSPRQFEDVVADLRAKVTRKGTQSWFFSQACRFIEQRASKKSRRIDAPAAGLRPVLYENPVGVDPPDVALRKATFPEDYA